MIAKTLDDKQKDYKWIAIGDMFLPKCQEGRALDERRVVKILASYNDAAFGVPILSYREHGDRGPRGEAYAIVSGQHRIEVARRQDRARVYCEIVYGLTEADEAQLFVDEDARKPQCPLGKFHLLRQAGDAEACAIWDIANAKGFIIAKGINDNFRRSIRCITTIIQAYRLGVLPGTLEVLAGAYDYDTHAATSQIVHGIARTLKSRPAIDQRRLAARLKSVGMVKLQGRYRSAIDAFASSARPLVMANIMIDIYNHRLSGEAIVEQIMAKETRQPAPEVQATGRMTALLTRKGKTLAEARAEVAARRAAGADPALAEWR